jgi:acetyltransferase-like isoleucine patch superfamily enzyme
MLGIIRRALFCLHSRLVHKSAISFFSSYLNPRHIALGRRVSIGSDSLLFPIRRYQDQQFDASITIGDGVYIGFHSQLHCIGALTIGTGSVISDYVYISDVAHGLSPLDGPIMQQRLTSKGPVTIGAHCFIGYGVSVLPGVELGKHTVVAARAVVTRSFPPYSMLVGNPARCVKTFDTALGSWVAP